MGHGIFFKVFDGSQNIFLCSIFIILLFKLNDLKHRISKLATKWIEERHHMLNKSHPHSRYKASNGKNKENCQINFDLDVRVIFTVIIVMVVKRKRCFTG